MNNAANEPRRVSFIRDVASTIDEFGAHQRLAEAIAKTIRTQPHLNVIGLLGSWGSGKSTVVQLLKTELTEGGDQVRTVFFPYDAWQHQSDAPKRAFLETLIQFLKDEGLTTRQQWKAALDRLNRQIENTETTSTPTITVSGAIILTLLLFVPLGSRFVDKSWLEHSKGQLDYSPTFWLGVLMLTAPLTVALILTGVRFFWRWARGKNSASELGEKAELLLLFANKSREKRIDRKWRDPEPTALEFRQFFRTVMRDIASEHRRVIFVIDNLDRLPDAEALGMWATIRSFFLGAAPADSNLPTVLLPVDEAALRRTSASEHPAEAQRIGDAFVEKTFDAVFRVNPPVGSRWREYLRKQLKVAFGADFPDADIDAATRILSARQLTEPELALTPRTINTLVNSMVSLWLQREGDELHFASIAYYAINRKTIEGNLTRAVREPEPLLEELDEDWQSAIAALFYGAPKAIALQVYLDGPLKEAIASADSEAFASLAKVEGFSAVLVQALDQARDGTLELSVANAASLIDGLEDSLRPMDAALAWLRLSQTFAQHTNWTSLAERDCLAVSLLLKKASPSQLGTIRGATIRKIEGLPPDALRETEVAARIAGLVHTLAESAISASQEPDEVAIPGTAGTFLSVLHLIDDPEEISHLFTDIDTDQIVEFVSNRFADGKHTEWIKPIIPKLNQWWDELDWTQLLDSAITSLNAEHKTLTPSGVDTLYQLWRYFSEGRPKIKEFASTGLLSVRLDDLLEKGHIAEAARALALLAVTDRGAEGLDVDDWEEVLSENPDLVEAVDNAFTTLDPTIELERLSLLSASSPAMTPLFAALVLRRLQEGRLGPLAATQVVESVGTYRKVVQGDAARIFWTYAAGLQGLQPALAGATEAQRLSALYVLLLNADRRPAWLAAFTVETLSGMPVARWEDAVRTARQPWPVAAALFAVDARRVIRGHAAAGLQRTLNEAIQGDDPKVAKRWFSLSRHIEQAERQRLYASIREQLLGSIEVAAMIDTLSEGGKLLLSDGAFGGEADRVAKLMLPRLVTVREGGKWMLANATSIADWLPGIRSVTRGALRSAIGKQLNEIADDDWRKELVRLRRLFK